MAPYHISLPSGPTYWVWCHVWSTIGSPLMHIPFPSLKVREQVCFSTILPPSLFSESLIPSVVSSPGDRCVATPLPLYPPLPGAKGQVWGGLALLWPPYLGGSPGLLLLLLPSFSSCIYMPAFHLLLPHLPLKREVASWDSKQGR